MNKSILSIRIISLCFVFMTCAVFSNAQNSSVNTIGDLAENLWSSYEQQLENQMEQQLPATHDEWHEFVSYKNDEFTRDRGSFFISFSRGEIGENNAAKYFDNLKDKYVALYKAYEKTKKEEHSPFIPAPPAIQGSCNPSCSNISFQNGTLSSWDAYYGVGGSSTAAIVINSLTGGTCGSVTKAGGPDPNTGNTFQVELMNGGNDPIAGGLIPLTPPLGGTCARIGDGPINGAGVGVLQQTYIVDPSNPILTIQYAVVLQNPGHTGFQQPWFRIQVLDQNNNVIPGCGQYFVAASSGNPGFKGVFYPGTGDSIYCKPWATAFVPLNNYIGQCITVKFEASDCALGGHLGYAYVASTCSKLNLVSSSAVFCNGQQSASLTGPPGAGSYQWTTSNGCISGSSTQQALKVTCAGTYSLITTATAGAQCVDTFSLDLPYSSAGPPPTPCFTATRVCSGNPTVFNASCSNPNGGGSTYYWDFFNTGQYQDSSGTSPSYTYTSGGLYKVKLHQVAANGCSSDTVITIPVDSTFSYNRPTITGGSTNATACGQCNGTLTVTINTTDTNTVVTNSFSNIKIFGSGKYTGTYNFISGVSISSSCINGKCKYTVRLTFANVCPGIYYFYMDPGFSVPASKCSPGGLLFDTALVTVSQNGVNITANINSSSATCGSNNGSATLTGYGGNAPYTFNWSNGLGTGAAKSNLAPGNYNITITDAQGCIGSAVVNIQAFNTLPALITPYNIKCFGSNNGYIKVLPYGGTGPFSYQWTPNVSAADSAGGLAPGSYSVTVTDGGGCSSTYNAVISQPAQLKDSIATAVTNVGCGGKGSATVFVKGGLSPYTFIWSDGNTKSSDTSLAVGVTTFTVTDGNGCTLKDSVTINASGSFTVSAGPDLTLCTNDSVQLQLTGVPGGSTFAWLPSAGLSCTSCSSPVAKPTASTTYSVTVTDGNGCTSTDAIAITVSPAIVATVIPADTTVCSGNFVQLQAGGGTTYSWSPSTGLTDPNASNPLAYVTSTVTYTVTVSTPGCSSATSTASIIVNPAPPVPTITQSNDTLYCSFSPSYKFYQWYSDATLIQGATNSYLVIDKSGNYNVQVRDDNDCSIAVGINVILTGVRNYSSFSSILVSPNPAKNELFVYSNSLLKEGVVTVFNVIGEVIIEEKIEKSNEIKIDIKNLPNGIYFLQLKSENGRLVSKFIKE